MPQEKYYTLDPAMIINAYAQGIFPTADNDGSIHWYAPDPRAILEHENLRISRSLRATIRKGIYEIRIDTAFEKVMQVCARRAETWINAAFFAAYTRLGTAPLTGERERRA
jgi:leucyl/phenylalanyl-tRNA--protein transferase